MPSGEHVEVKTCRADLALGGRDWQLVALEQAAAEQAASEWTCPV